MLLGLFITENYSHRFKYTLRKEMILRREIDKLKIVLKTHLQAKDFTLGLKRFRKKAEEVDEEINGVHSFLKIVGRGQEAKPAVVTPSLQQWRSPSTFRGAPGEDPLKWLKEYDRVANFNKWDDMMCLANVYFFLDGTARQWYVNNEDALDSWEAFKNGLSGLFCDCQKYTRRAEEQLKCRAQRSGESTQSYIQSVLGLCQEVNPLMREDEKVSHLMKGVAEDIYQALLTREINDTASFIKWCNYIEDMKQKRVGRPRFERLPNVVPVASLTDETDLVSLIRTIVREEVNRLVNQTQESLDSDPQSLEEIVQDEVERVLAPVSTKPTETRPRPTYAAVTRKYRAPVQKFPPEPRKQMCGERLTTDLFVSTADALDM
ncbi:retrotrans_gag domain-containing protein [Trichonephila clavipes]|nr:retrotrans_gag domain-containing protein [Trichonephila clavipes]